MNAKQKQNFEELETVSVFEADRSNLMSECGEILATCARLPNSVAVTVAEEMIDGISGLIDLGSELTLLKRCLNEIAGGVEDPGTDDHDTARQLSVFAGQLDDLTAQSNDSARSLINLIADLINGGV